MPRNTEADELPESIEELLGFVLRHLASELRVDECPAPLAESLRTYTRAVMAAERAAHEHPTPVVEVCDRDVAVEDAGGEQPGNNRPSEYARPTLPTEPPVSYDDPPNTGRTSRGFPLPR